MLLLDEPTRGLDYGAKHRLAEILTELAAAGRAVLVSTHDVEFVATVAGRVVVMADGEVVADGPAQDVIGSSPMFAPQVAKVLAPAGWLTVDQVAAGLALAAGSGRAGTAEPAERRPGRAPDERRTRARTSWPPLRTAGRPRGSAPRRSAIPVAPLSAVVLLLASIGGLMMFIWPLLISAEPQPQQHVSDAPFVFMAILPVLVLLVLTQLGDGGMDTKALAMLGVLAAVNAALRPLGAGLNGIETVFFLLILAGRVFGPGFGFLLGCTSLFASALLTAGVGPWLPFQMLAAAWIGLGAGLLPRRMFGRPIRGAGEIALLAGYGVLAAYVFGALMNMWFWPFVTGNDER